MTDGLCAAVRHIVKYDHPGKDGLTLRNQLMQVGRPPRPASPPEAVEYLFGWFWELHAARTSNGFGPNPLSYSEILAWSQLCDVGLRPTETRLIRAMDAAYLKAVADG